MSRRMAAHQDQISVSGSPVDFKKIQRDAVTPEELEVVRQKISAAAYTLGGQDLKRLFQHIDKDHSNSVDEEEFINFVRRVLKLSPKTVSEGQISACFHAIDADGNGTIEFSELIAFVGKFDMSSKESLEAFLEKKKAIDQVLKEAEDDDAFRQYATVTPSLHQMEATNSAENLIHLSSPTALISGGWAEIKHSLRASPQSPDENRDQSIPEDPAHFRQSLSQIVEKFGQFGVPRNGRKSFGELDAIEIRAAAAKLHTGLRRKLAMDKIHIDSNNIEKLLIDECSSYPPALSPNDKRKQKRNAKLFVVSKFQRICRSAAQTVALDGMRFSVFTIPTKMAVLVI
jgi:Ca2+-binding EF-hand superfamily protein